MLLCQSRDVCGDQVERMVRSSLFVRDVLVLQAHPILPALLSSPESITQITVESRGLV